MNGAAWVFLAAFAVTSLLMMIAVEAYTDLARELRHLRRQQAAQQGARAGGAR